MLQKLGKDFLMRSDLQVCITALTLAVKLDQTVTASLIDVVLVLKIVAEYLRTAVQRGLLNCGRHITFLISI